MVDISLDDALSHVGRLCQDVIDLEQIADYTGPHNFRVGQRCLFVYIDVLIPCYLLLLDRHLDLAIPQASVIGIH